MTQLELDALEVIYGARRWTVLEGDCLELLDRLPSSSVDAIVTDPPAGIGFMGKDWDEDRGGAEAWINWLSLRARAAFRVLKPGGHALVWALPRTSHWTGRALEEAGFEVRDRIAHLFGSGFPKSLDVSKEIDKRAGAERQVIGRKAAKSNNGANEIFGVFKAHSEHLPVTAPATPEAEAWNGWGTALKPAAEDWWLVRRPPADSVAKNLLERGVGALNIHGCRVPHISAEDFDKHAASVEAIKQRGWGGRETDVQFNASPIEGCADVTPAGRWPAHIVLSHGPDCRRIGLRKVKAAPAWTESRAQSLFAGKETSAVHHAEPDGFEVIEHWRCAPGCPALMLDEQSGVTSSASEPAPRWGREAGGGWGMSDGGEVQAYGDEGGASRYFTQLPFDDSALEYEPFFYTAKASTDERESGCEHLEPVTAAVVTGRKEGSKGLDPRAGMHDKYGDRVGKFGQTRGRRNHHPTVKSIELMRWLCRLITPAGGIVLDLFSGSGSTGVACSAERFRFIGLELSPAYVKIARARIVGDAPLLNSVGV